MGSSSSASSTASGSTSTAAASSSACSSGSTSSWAATGFFARRASALAFAVDGFFFDSFSFSLEGAFSRDDRAAVVDLADFLVGIGGRLQKLMCERAALSPVRARSQTTSWGWGRGSLELALQPE